MEIGVEKVGLLGLELKKYKMNLQYLVTITKYSKRKKRKIETVKRVHPSLKGFPLAKLGAISIT